MSYAVPTLGVAAMVTTAQVTAHGGQGCGVLQHASATEPLMMTMRWLAEGLVTSWATLPELTVVTPFIVLAVRRTACARLLALKMKAASVSEMRATAFDGATEVPV